MIIIEILCLALPVYCFLSFSKKGDGLWDVFFLRKFMYQSGSSLKTTSLSGFWFRKFKRDFDRGKRDTCLVGVTEKSRTREND